MGYRDLANAIVRQAAEDYWNALITLVCPEVSSLTEYEARKLKKNCDKFFVSDWFGSLTMLDADALAEKIKRETEDFKKAKLWLENAKDGSAEVIGKLSAENQRKILKDIYVKGKPLKNCERSFKAHNNAVLQLIPALKKGRYI
ncbi:MAG: hypothetical protein NC131_09185 [Roseburia sp.]|nr:hypothetical protein [Roseburia sp.]